LELSVNALLLEPIRREVDNHPRPRAFLDSIGNNSMRTRNNYETGLVHLQRFLYSRFNGEHNIDSVIKSILQNQLNVYELLDNFVSYEGSKKIYMDARFLL